MAFSQSKQELQVIRDLKLLLRPVTPPEYDKSISQSINARFLKRPK